MTYTPPSGTAQWYRADDLTLSNGDPVTTWADASGNSLDLAAGTAPTFTASAVNSKPGVTFTAASSQYLTRTTGMGSLLSGAAGVTAVVLYNQAARTAETQHAWFASTGSSTSNTRARHALGATTSRPTPGGRRLDADSLGSATGGAGSDIALATYGISTQALDHSAGTASSWRNGSNVQNAASTGLTTGTISATAASATRVGSQTTTAGFFNGTIVEILVYARVLTALERAQAHTYLADKYAIAVADYIAQGSGQVEATTDAPATATPVVPGTAAAASSSAASATATPVVPGTAAADAISGTAAQPTPIRPGSGQVEATTDAPATATPMIPADPTGVSAQTTAATATATNVITATALASAATETFATALTVLGASGEVFAPSGAAGRAGHNLHSTYPRLSGAHTARAAGTTAPRVVGTTPPRQS